MEKGNINPFLFYYTKMSQLILKNIDLYEKWCYYSYRNKEQGEIIMLQKLRQWNEDRMTMRFLKCVEEFKNADNMIKLRGTHQRMLITSVGQVPKFIVDYVGGHPEKPSEEKNVKLIMLDEGLTWSNFYQILPWEEIKSVQFKTKEEISKDVTLTRMLMIGAYAFALKKKTRTVQQFVILRCERNGQDYAVAFTGHDSDKLYSLIFKKLAGEM